MWHNLCIDLPMNYKGGVLPKQPQMRVGIPKYIVSIRGADKNTGIDFLLKFDGHVRELIENKKHQGCGSDYLKYSNL